ncbi:DUF3558 domain-containing protein [Corynebacterium nasicanis]|uniref:DUF3558 domain-containing protein n=1 Tax=Corynebacterium nasicanis TaxID=1448267 RepID=A0ABW1QAS7_9CORY
MPARRLLPAIFGAGLLAACSTTTDTLIDAPPSSTTQPPAAPVLELGDFDPAGEFQVFNPCTEIPAEVLEAAGLGEAVGEPSYDRGLSASCSFLPLDDSVRGYFSLTGDRVPKDRIKERSLLLSDSAGSAYSDTYLHHMGADFPDECSAAIHTNRGRFVVQYTEISTKQERTALCEIATEKFDTILNLMGESNGDFYRP